MVNNGVSGACDACKQRHKKCDESRPSCLRCTKAGRECVGYNVSKDRKFVNYSGKFYPPVNQKDPEVLQHSQTLNFTHLDTPEWLDIDQGARSEFFFNYCIVSSEPNLSRGYLNGLQTMVAKAGRTSEISQACTVIALANKGRASGNHMLIQRADHLYSELLRSFRLSIANEAIFTTIESLITAALLGLYEIITCTATHPGAHFAHARGVSAILISKYSPFDLACGGALFEVANPLSLEDLEMRQPQVSTPGHALVNNTTSQRFSILCTPLFRQPNTTLDRVFAQTEPLVRRATILLSGEAKLDELYRLRLEAEKLKEGYNNWPESLSEQWKPIPIGKITSKDNGRQSTVKLYGADNASMGDDQELNGYFTQKLTSNTRPDVGYWPGTVTSYYDLYVASIWNSYRKARLLVLNIIINCSRRINTSLNLDESGTDAAIYKEVEELTEGIVSSIPFLLAADVHTFLAKATVGETLVPGRSVGGMLLMHAIYVVAALPIVEVKLQNYLKECLEWIGDRMYIGHATILSKCTMSDFYDYANYATEAHVIIWAGMLI